MVVAHNGKLMVYGKLLFFKIHIVLGYLLQEMDSLCFV